MTANAGAEWKIVLNVMGGVITQSIWIENDCRSSRPVIVQYLKTVLEICDRHVQHMHYATDSLKDIFPINIKTHKGLSQDQISRTDQLIYRFSQLQDTIGYKLYPLIRDGLGEYAPNIPYIDILNSLEKLSILESAEQWLSLREIL